MESKVYSKLYAPKPKKHTYFKKAFPRNNKQITEHCLGIEADISSINNLRCLNEWDHALKSSFYDFEKELKQTLEHEQISREIISILRCNSIRQCSNEKLKNIYFIYQKYKDSKVLDRPKNPFYKYYESILDNKTS